MKDILNGCWRKNADCSHCPRLLVLAGTLWLAFFPAGAQALRGTTGLLHAPTAEMQRDKTVMVGGNVLHTIPLRYYNFDVAYTFNYYANITFFPWLEVGYTCTLNYANRGSSYFPPHSWGKYTNQDRSFNVRLRAWKEGWWKPWTPQVVLGADDPGTHERYGGGGIASRDQNGGNSFFCRYYVAATRHFRFASVGTLGAHLSWVCDRPATWHHHNRPAVGADFRFVLPEEVFRYAALLNGLTLMAEYDARTLNVGMHYQLWKDRFHLIAELNRGRYFSAGMYVKIHLK